MLSTSMENFALKHAWFLALLLLTTACTEEPPKATAPWGSPDYVATQFFHALYNDKDLEKAQRLSTKEYAALMASYGSVRQVGRTLMNVSFDSVSIRINPSSGNLREQYDDQADIAIVLSGTHDDKQVDEMRVVELVRRNGNWVVQSVKVDKFSSSAR
jgi:hypothetical protein